MVTEVFTGGCSCGDGRVHRRWYGGSLHRRQEMVVMEVVVDVVSCGGGSGLGIKHEDINTCCTS